MKKLLLIFSLCFSCIVYAENEKSFMFNNIEEQKISTTTIENYFFQWFLLDEKYTFKKVSDKIDELGLQHVNYKEFYKGIEVEGALIMVHAKDSIVYCVNGSIMENDASVKPNVSQLKSSSIDESSQRIIAIQKNGKTEYRVASIAREGMYDLYRDAQTGEILKKKSFFRNYGDIQGSAYTFYNGLQNITNYENEGVYYLMDEQRNIITCDGSWADAESETIEDYVNSCSPFYSGFSLWAKPILTEICIDYSSDWWEAKMTDQNPDFFVKVKDQYGNTLYTSSVKDDINPPITWYVNIPLDGEKITIELYEEDVLKNDGPISEVCATYRGKEDTYYHKWDEGYTHGRLYFTQTSPEFDAHWGMEKTYDYYLNTFNRKSYDGKGSIIYNILNAAIFDDFNAAAITGAEPYPMLYGKGGIYNSTLFNPFVNLDIMGHEFTHLVTEFNGNGGLEYIGEAGALNESFSDIFGTCVEFFAKGEDANWYMGDGLMPAYTNLRDMSDPKNGMDGDIIYAVCGYPQPDTYGGDYWQDITAGDDNGGVHRNSGVQNYWFYLLCEGGFGTNDNGEEYSVTGIGLNDAQKITYRNLMTYLTPMATFRDACDGSIQSARDFFGKNSTQEQTVRDAWHAVGVSYTVKSDYLSELIEYADSLIQNTQIGTDIGQYGQTEYLALDSETKSAKTLLTTEENTQQEINLQATKLEIAIENYCESVIVDKDNLQKLITKADSLLINTTVGTKPEQYGQAEFLALSNEKETAQETYDSKTALQYEIDDECANLQTAISNYESSQVPVDESKLLSAVLTANTLLEHTQVGTEEGQYGQAEYLSLNAAKKVAEKLLESDGVRQSEINDETKTLTDAINAYKNSIVGATAVSETEQSLAVSIIGQTIFCEQPFLIFDVLGQDVTNKNGVLQVGSYIVTTAQFSQKVVVK